MLITLSSYSSLNVARVKHNPNPTSNTLWGEIPRELTLDYSIASVAPANLTPVHSELTSILTTTRRSLSDVGNTLSEVELSILLWVTSLDFDEGGVVVLVAKATLVPENGPRKIEANWLGILLGHGLFICLGSTCWENNGVSVEDDNAQQLRIGWRDRRSKHLCIERKWHHHTKIKSSIKERNNNDFVNSR